MVKAGRKGTRTGNKSWGRLKSTKVQRQNRKKTKSVLFSGGLFVLTLLAGGICIFCFRKLCIGALVYIYLELLFEEKREFKEGFAQIDIHLFFSEFSKMKSHNEKNLFS